MERRRVGAGADDGGEPRAIGAVATEGVLDERLDLELVHPRLDRAHRFLLRLDGDVDRLAQQLELGGALLSAERGHGLRRIGHARARRAVHQALDDLRIGRFELAAELPHHVQRLPRREQRVECGLELAHGARRNARQARRALGTVAPARPHLAARLARLDEQPARRLAAALDHHEPRVGLIVAREVLEARRLHEGEIVLRRLARAEREEDAVGGKARQERRATRGVLRLRNLRAERRRGKAQHCTKKKSAATHEQAPVVGREVIRAARVRRSAG